MLSCFTPPCCSFGSHPPALLLVHILIMSWWFITSCCSVGLHPFNVLFVHCFLISCWFTASCCLLVHYLLFFDSRPIAVLIVHLHLLSWWFTSACCPVGPHPLLVLLVHNPCHSVCSRTVAALLVHIPLLPCWTHPLLSFWSTSSCCYVGLLRVQYPLTLFVSLRFAVLLICSP